MGGFCAASRAMPVSFLTPIYRESRLRRDGRLDPEALRTLAAPIDVPHRCVGGLDAATKAIVVEQREAGPVVRELAPNRGKPGGVGREAQRQGLVVLEVVRHELRQARSLEQAGPDPAGKEGAHA